MNNVLTKVNDKTYKSIDILKFILSIFIIGIHTNPFGTGTIGLAIKLVIFPLAVPLFFATSGFFLCKKFLYHNTKDMNHITTSYCIRLGKIYLIWTLLYLPHIINDYQNREGWGLIDNGAQIILRNLFFAGSYNQLWYLIASIWGGALLFLAIKYLKSEHKVVVVCISIYLIALLLDSCSGVLPEFLNLIPYYYNGYFNSIRNGVLFGLPFIGIGLVAYRVLERKIAKKILVVSTILFFMFRVVATFIIKYYDMEYNMEITPGTWGTTLCILVFLLQMDVPISVDLSIWLRKSSILVFLIHPYMIDIAKQLTSDTNVLFILVVFFSLLFSTVVMLGERTKIFHWLKYLY